MQDDINELKLAIIHCQEVITRCQQHHLCKDSHIQLKKWLEELLEFRKITYPYLFVKED